MRCNGAPDFPKHDIRVEQLLHFVFVGKDHVEPVPGNTRMSTITCFDVEWKYFIVGPVKEANHLHPQALTGNRKSGSIQNSVIKLYIDELLSQRSKWILLGTILT